ncbi:MAG: diacylglycerol kinase family lipid kinase [Dehalococcoidales bacterium]|nr:diacylglycerol kinase family lipid kinase [Dehalococcoidales bacterium]
MIKAELIYNPHGGQVVVRHALEAVVSFLTRNGWSVTYRETTMATEATQLARSAVRNGAEVVIAAGGDGTVSEVASGLLHTDTALGVLPVGTSNSWALQMGIPALNPLWPTSRIAKVVADIEERVNFSMPGSYYRRVLLDAAQVLVERHTVAVDVGEVAGRYFMMWAGIGLDAAVLESVPPMEKAALGTWAYLITALGAAGRNSSPDVKLTLDGKTIEVNTQLIVVSNIQLYGGIMAIGSRAVVNDGKLDVCIFKGDGFFTFAQHALKVFSHQHLRDPSTEYYQCGEIVIESSHALPVHVDGEPFTQTPVTIRVLPSALNVIVPENVPGNLFGQS